MMDKMNSPSIRYQVFVSSTFTDLKEERAEVLQALWELECFPIGMEAFVATNESQWEVIEKVIVECDYYILIIGGRYGSVSSEGISYTEKEYNYAKSLDIPVLAFVHADPGSIARNKSESDIALSEKLDRFRAKVMAEHPIKSWTTPADLGGHVSRALVRAIKVQPRSGWQRSSGQSDIELLKQVNQLRIENEQLREKAALRDREEQEIPDLQKGADIYIIKGASSYKVGSAPMKLVHWKAPASWDNIFEEIGPKLQHEASEDELRSSISRFVAWSDVKAERDRTSSNVILESFNEIVVQFRALGFIERGKRKRPISDKSGYWCLTEKGDKYLVSLMAKKKDQSPASLPSGSDEDALS